MAIEAESFYKAKRLQFQQSSSIGRFNDDYVDAVNQALDDLTLRLDKSSSPSTYINDTETDININSYERQALSRWVDYYLIIAGHRSGEMTVGTAFATANGATAAARVRRDNDLANDATNDADDGDCPDVIGMIDTE